MGVAGCLSATVLIALAIAAPAHAGTWQGGPVTIADGLGAPYPSTISVFGDKAIVSHVSVRLRDLTHSSTEDVDVLLVGPQGQRALLLSDTGPGSVTSATVNLDDQAALNAFDSVSGGTYRPTNKDDGSVDAFPFSLAPSGPYGTELGVFDGVDPNGVWRLYVVDDKPGDTGSMAGWRLSITGRTPARARVRPGPEPRPRVRENAGKIRLTVIRMPPSKAPTLQTGRLTYSAAPFLRATPTEDFGAASGALEFAPGQISKTFTIPVVNDHVPEPSEWFTVRFESSGDVSAPARRIEIRDDDPRAASPSLGGRKTQRVRKRGTIVVRARPNAYGTLKATGKVALPGLAARSVRLKSVTRKVSRGRQATLKLRLSRKNKRAVLRALRRKRRVRATVKVTLRDLAGGKATATRRISLIR